MLLQLPTTYRRLPLVVSSARRVPTMGLHDTTLVILGLVAVIVSVTIAAPASVAPEPQTEDVIPIEDNLPPYDTAEEPCRVANVQYKHGEKVPRADPCELCLCLHSGLFCWWQDQPGCPQHSTGTASHPTNDVTYSNTPPSTDSPPCVRESCESGIFVASSPPPTASTSTGESATQSVPTTASSHETSGEPQATLSSVASAAASAPMDASSTPPASTTLPRATTCSVMGTEYQIGQVLPRATGTCLECVCGEGARLSCSPKDCGNTSSGTTHETGNGGPGTNNDLDLGPSLDMFDVDTF